MEVLTQNVGGAVPTSRGALESSLRSPKRSRGEAASEEVESGKRSRSAEPAEAVLRRIVAASPKGTDDVRGLLSMLDAGEALVLEHIKDPQVAQELERLLKQKKIIEEMNKKKKQLLAQELATRRAKTAEEGAALQRIEAELKRWVGVAWQRSLHGQGSRSVWVC